MCDLYFYRDPEEIEKDEQVALEKQQQKELETEAPAPDWTAEPVSVIKLLLTCFVLL